MQKLCLSTKFPYQENRWNHGTLCSGKFSSANYQLRRDGIQNILWKSFGFEFFKHAGKCSMGNEKNLFNIYSAIVLFLYNYIRNRYHRINNISSYTSATFLSKFSRSNSSCSSAFATKFCWMTKTFSNEIKL